jgi:hypothetical protein
MLAAHASTVAETVRRNNARGDTRPCRCARRHAGARSRRRPSRINVRKGSAAPNGGEALPRRRRTDFAMKNTWRAELEPLPYSRRRNRIRNVFLWEAVSVVADLRLEPTDVSAFSDQPHLRPSGEFANRKNIQCASMAGLGSQKLANPLKSEGFHRSLGSARQLGCC